LSSTNSKAALAIGIIIAVVALILVLIFVRRWALNRGLIQRADRAGYMKG
jgi:hypothetical protein